MQHMKRVGILLTVLCSYALPAHAVEIFFNPLEVTTPLGGAVGVDVVVSGLGAPGSTREVISAFDLDVLFDSSILSFNRLVFSDALGLVDFDTFTGVVGSPGRIDFANLSLLGNADLLATQGNQIVLASLFFDAIAFGTSMLSFDSSVLGGLELIGLDPFATLALDSVGTGQITVAAAQSVPEPGALSLLGLTLAGLGVLRSRKARVAVAA